MIFEKIHSVPTSDELLDKAFRRASRARRGKKIRDIKSNREAYESMILTSANILSDNLANIVRRFPDFDELSDFYYDLADIIAGVDKLKISLGSIYWASEKIHDLGRERIGKIRSSNDPQTIQKEVYGRMSSIMNSIDKDLKFLNEARNTLRKLPDVDVNEPTIVVAGYPNTGKSSFVTIATKAHPEIATYPFTTKGISIGHFTRDNIRYQVIDTPGLLDRPMSDRNDIELQAVTALKHLGSVLLYLVDASETCGYTVDDQKHLFEEIRQQFKIPVLVVSNKSDLPEFQELGFVDMEMSTVTHEGVDEVVDKLVDIIGAKQDFFRNVSEPLK
ncbi:MAG: NOG1 family protein [Methanohalobium sp.]|uniref:NOG1 family protein n=1 Tax=Methanohalobium sp. TaxID=2837493 RepID=UPI00397DF85A